MPPVMQALNQHTFDYVSNEMTEMNKAYTGEGHIPFYANTCTQCFAAAYEVGRSTLNGHQAPFVLFSLDRHQAKDFFESSDYLQATTEPQFGDIVTVASSYEMFEWTKLTAGGDIAEKGPSLGSHRFLNHAMLYIDENLVFEKSDSGWGEPYRFYYLDQSAKRFSGDQPLDQPVSYFRPTEKRWPAPSMIFGRQDNAVDDRFLNQDLPAILQDNMHINRELFYPTFDAHNNLTTSVELPIYVNMKNRASFGNIAYDKEYFSPVQVIKRACSKLFE